MSVVILSTTTNNMGTGATILLNGANYVIGDITTVLSELIANSSGGDVVFTAQLQSTNLSTGVVTPIQQFRFVESATANQIIFANQVIQRSFPSLLMLPRNSEIQFNVTNFTNLVEVNVTLDMTGFMY
jgi:hypothetical protein